MPRKKLTDKQKAFVREYLVDWNAAQAAIRAGYSEKTARVIGAQNLSKLNIAAAIENAQLKRSLRVGVTADNVLRELAILAQSDVMRHFTIDPLTGQAVVDEDAPAEMSRAVSSLEVNSTDSGIQTKIKMWDKPKALHLLAKHLGMLVERHAIDHGANLHQIIAVNPGGSPPRDLSPEEEKESTPGDQPRVHVFEIPPEPNISS